MFIDFILYIIKVRHDDIINRICKIAVYKDKREKTPEKKREGLKKKLDSLEKQYGRISHRNKFDTLVSRNYKEDLEREMEQVKKDIECINKDIVTVDMTK